MLLVPPPGPDVDLLALAQDVRTELDDLRLVGVTDGDGGDFALGEVLAATPDEPFAVDHDANAPGLAMATSGTTELSRLSIWTDNNLRFFLQQFGLAVGMEAGDVAVGVAPANSGSTGYVFPVLAPLLHSASSVLLEHWSPPAALDLLATEGATHRHGRAHPAHQDAAGPVDRRAPLRAAGVQQRRRTARAPGRRRGGAGRSAARSRRSTERAMAACRS